MFCNVARVNPLVDAVATAVVVVVISSVRYAQRQSSLKSTTTTCKPPLEFLRRQWTPTAGQ